MSEFRRPRPEDTFIWPDSTWASSYRAMLADQAYAKAWELFHETDSGSRVVGGFRATESSALTTRIERGMALVYDAAAVAPAPKWKVVFNPGNITGTHVAHEGTHRIDVVSLSYAMVADSSQILGRVAGAMPAATNTEIGCVCTVVVTKGTAGGTDPTVPATPAGNIKLWEVYVPATSGALVYLDTRFFAPGPKSRPQDMPMRVHSTVGSGDELPLAEFKQRASGAGTMTADYLVDFASSLGWDLGSDTPFIRRNRGASGEVTGKMHLMMSPTRTWRRSYPLGIGGSIYYSTGSQTEITVKLLGPYTEIKRATSSANVGSYSVPLPIDLRALKVTDFRLAVKLQTAFTGTVNVLKAELIKITAAGGSTVIGSKTNLNAMTTGVWTTLVAADFGPLTQGVVADAEALYVSISWDLAASAGELHIRMAELALTEGKT